MTDSSATGPDSGLQARRGRAMGPGYRLFYREPVHLVRGEGAWLYDAGGRRYLDCYNNVASVGHCHPQVVAALSRQAGLLNTHTRYLHADVVRYAERLAATLPAPLSVCMFTCTGTEANELAVRIARSVTGRHGVIVSEDAYHGNSWTVTQLSTAEYPRAERPDWLETVEVPDPLRGRFRGGEYGWGGRYAAQAGEAIGRLSGRGHALAMFLCDTVFDAAGLQVPPAGYFAGVYAQVRAAGGLVVADEVQSGLGRMGGHTWGFQDHGVIPDIVTMGKPLGDGHPLAAVATTPDIAAAFAQRHHYFNTFGGNPVSAAVGLAVLDVYEGENLLGNARDTGGQLAAGLQRLADRHPCIAQVRGKGLFYGIDFGDHAGLPDPAAATAVCEGLRERGILTATTGPHGNVLKVRPPLVFDRDQAGLLLAALGDVLSAA